MHNGLWILKLIGYVNFMLGKLLLLKRSKRVGGRSETTSCISWPRSCPKRPDGTAAIPMANLLLGFIVSTWSKLRQKGRNCSTTPATWMPRGACFSRSSIEHSESHDGAARHALQLISPANGGYVGAQPKKMLTAEQL